MIAGQKLRCLSLLKKNINLLPCKSSSNSRSPDLLYPRPLSVAIHESNERINSWPFIISSVLFSFWGLMSDGPRLFSLNYFEFFRISHFVDLYTCNVSLVGSPRMQLLDTPIKELYIYQITISKFFQCWFCQVTTCERYDAFSLVKAQP